MHKTIGVDEDEDEDFISFRSGRQGVMPIIHPPTWIAIDFSHQPKPKFENPNFKHHVSEHLTSPPTGAVSLWYLRLSFLFVISNPNFKFP